MIFAAIADEIGCIAKFVHGLVTGIDTGATVDALILQAVTYVYSCGADIDTQVTVDTITQLGGLFALSRPTGLTATGFIGYCDRISVKHSRLKSGIGAQVQAHHLSHPGGINVGTDGKKPYPGCEHGAGSEAEYLWVDAGGWDKISDKTAASEQGYQPPKQMLTGAFDYLVSVPRALVQNPALIVTAFDTVFYPHKDKRPGCLWAEISTPDSPEKSGDKKQQKCRRYENPG